MIFPAMPGPHISAIPLNDDLHAYAAMWGYCRIPEDFLVGDCGDHGSKSHAPVIKADHSHQRMPVNYKKKFSLGYTYIYQLALRSEFKHLLFCSRQDFSARCAPEYQKVLVSASRLSGFDM